MNDDNILNKFVENQKRVREGRELLISEDRKFKKAKLERDENRYLIESAYLRFLYQVLIKGDKVSKKKYIRMTNYANALGKPTPDHFASMTMEELIETRLFENIRFTNYVAGFMIRNAKKKLKPVGKNILDDELNNYDNSMDDKNKDKDDNDK